MRVKDCMTKQVVSISAAEPASVAARMMARYNIGALPVHGSGGRLEGIVTDRDIVLRCIAAGKSPKSVRVHELMTGRVATAAPDTDVSAAAGIMASEQVRRLLRGRAAAGCAAARLLKRKNGIFFAFIFQKHEKIEKMI